MDAEELKRKKNDFRKYLRKEEDCHSFVLGSLMKAAESYLPAYIRDHFDSNFRSLFDSNNSVEDLICIFLEMEKNGIGEKQAFTMQKCLKAYISYHCNLNGLDKDALFSDVKAKNAKKQTEYWEGTEKSSVSVRYERDKDARAKCLERYGFKCQVCGIDMEEKYGMYGHNFIEVHHIVPISKQGGAYKLDPIKDLRPLCPNCHAMIHRSRKQDTDEIMTVDEFKDYYNRLSKYSSFNEP